MSAPLSTGELAELDHTLTHITTDLTARLAITVTTPWTRTSITGPHVQTQPSSRPPYPIGAEHTLTTLREVLAQTITAISAHRHQEPPENITTLVQAATWLRKHHIALAGMADGRAHADTLHRAVTAARRAVTTSDDQPMHVTPSMVADANRQLMTAQQIARLAYKLGDQAKGLTYERIRTLVRRDALKAADIDQDTSTRFYRLGDVLAAHRAHRRRA